MHDNKVKISLMFRGREMEHKNLGFDRVQQAVEDLKTMATADSAPRMVGRHISVTLSPLPKSQRKPKYNLPDEIPELAELVDEGEDEELEEEGDEEELEDDEGHANEESLESKVSED